MINRLILRLVQIWCWPVAEKFKKCIHDPRAAQRTLLNEIVALHADTARGRALGLAKILEQDAEAAFRRLVPISDFDDAEFQNWIRRQQESPWSAIVAPGGIRHFEPTSGSSGRQKLIPYNRALLKSFDRYFQIWLYDLISRGPKLNTLRLFMCISPSRPLTNDTGQSTAPIGLADDSEYISPTLRWILRKFLSVPLDLKFETESDQYRDRLASFLAADCDLEVISIWHPSFFSMIWNHIVVSRRRIADLIERAVLAGDLPRRASTAVVTLRSNETLNPGDLWPKLKLISAWDSANSRLPAERLRQLLPHASFQGKGLLATEAPMTVPLEGIGAVPFITDVLFEFADESGALHWIDEVQDGKEYSLIISQKSGLLRYRIYDRVRVRHISGQETPALEFIGRTQDTSDLVGEKLTAGYLAAHDESFSNEYGAAFYVFLPCCANLATSSQSGKYLALVETPEVSHEDISKDDAMSEWWESRLEQSHHYSHARRLSQLDQVQVYRVRSLQNRLLEFYSEKRAMKMGDIKLRSLINSIEESEAILAEFGLTQKGVLT